MDAQLTRLYQDELAHLREMGREFAAEHPKIAARLTLDGLEVADPYVERLLEGFAFLAARVRLRLDAEHPRLIAQLLESLHPNLLAPCPSMAVMRFEVDPADPNLARGATVPRGSAVVSTLARGQQTFCEFRTAQAVTLWPLEVTRVDYALQAPELPTAWLPEARATRGVLRVRLRCGPGQRLAELPIEQLSFHLAGSDDVAFRLHEMLLRHLLGTLVVTPGTSSPGRSAWADARASLRFGGTGDDEALLHDSLRGFSGHRLLQEVAAMPQRLLFVEIGALRSRLASISGDTADLLLLFDEGDATLQPRVDSASLQLHATPAINLFSHRLDRVVLTPDQHEHHLVPDRARPLDLEVHSVESVVGHGPGGTHRFRPLFDWRAQQDDERDEAFGAAARAAGPSGAFTTRREPRRLSQAQRQHGSRVLGYGGDEVWLTLQDPGHGAHRDDLRQLAVRAWVTNRDLPALLPAGGNAGDDAWRLDAPVPVRAVRCLRGPTRPFARPPSGPVGWQLVALLGQNHLGPGDDPQTAAAALRDLLRILGRPDDAAWARQIDGIRLLQTRLVFQRLPLPGPSCFGSGQHVTLTIDESSFQGTGPWLLGAMLEVFFARYAAINSFSRFTLASTARGELHTWQARVGQLPIG